MLPMIFSNKEDMRIPGQILGQKSVDSHAKRWTLSGIESLPRQYYATVPTMCRGRHFYPRAKEVKDISYPRAKEVTNQGSAGI